MAAHSPSATALMPAPHRGRLRAPGLLTPARLRAPHVALLGAGAAVAVGYLTKQNPAAAPSHLAVPVRVAIIGAFTAAAVYAQGGKLRSEMARPLALAALTSSLWLLNGAAAPLPFSVGVLCVGLAPGVASYVLLAHPTGRLHSRFEQRFLIWSGGLVAGLWLAGIEISGQPPLRTPMLACAPHCQPNLFSLAVSRTPPAALGVVLALAWLTLTAGTAILIHRRDRSAPAALRRSLAPVRAAATTAAILAATFAVLRLSGERPQSVVGFMYVAGVIVVPVAVLAGLAMERLFMGQALARLVRQFARFPERDPRAFIAESLNDPTLEIAYLRPDSGTYVDASGARLALPLTASDRAVSWVTREGRPVAAVIYDGELSDQDGFIEAVGAAALIRLERARLEAELKASTTELAESRVRLVESADAERRRLERDLHDGVQQDLVGLRIKLELAAAAIREDPGEGERLVGAVGRQMDEVLQTLRAFARGIYPAVLHERGLPDALRSAARNSPAHVAVRAIDVGRYREDVEVAIYFCCLEALQNVAKHAGPDVHVTVRLWQRGPMIHFEVRDFGRGFQPASAGGGSGLSNMRDRIEAIGGHLAISSAPGLGTTVKGRLPVTEAEAPMLTGCG